MRNRRSLAPALAMFALAAMALVTSLEARILSYAPYSDRQSAVGLQNRLNRHFAVVEGTPSYQGLLLSPVPPNNYGFGMVGELVIYDSTGGEEPKVVLPQDGTTASFAAVAVREDDRNVPTLLVQTDANYAGTNPQRKVLWLFSSDGGTTWKTLRLATDFMLQLGAYELDFGGPFAHANHMNIRVGTAQWPFVIAVGTLPANAVNAIGADGTVRAMLQDGTSSYALAGSNRDGTRFLVQRAPDMALLSVGIDGSVAPIGQITPLARTEGWITPSGGAYLLEDMNAGRSLYVYNGNGSRELIASAPLQSDQLALFAIPTADYRGAWYITRGPSQPTTLVSYLPETGSRKQWQDISGPQVEALHAGRSGNTLVIQVHRPRALADTRTFRDPAIAVWHVGEPAPVSFDELFMDEQYTKGFVHLDPDTVADGEPFIFDSGIQISNGGIIVSPAPPSSGGGSDVVQEWGVVRASLRQHLVLPGVAHTGGAYGSEWLTDVVIHNPADTPTDVDLQYVANGDTLQQVRLRTVTLAPHEIRLYKDVLGSLFLLGNAGGALFINPQNGHTVDVTSRTYTKSANGSYGFGMNAIDVYSAARPRFPVTFAGAFPGSNFRTNLLLTDVSGRGSEVSLSTAGPYGFVGANGVSFLAPAYGQQQVNGVGAWLGLQQSDIASLLFRPARGEAVASVIAIDNRTNDPTYFPPDLVGAASRSIAAIGHVEGANGSHFRSDLYLYNPSSSVRSINLQIRPWDAPTASTSIILPLLPHEARMIPDALSTLFNRSGVARLILYSTSDGVRATSRTYTVDANGGTYGFLMPPLNSFQTAGPGDALEILGAVGDANFRTNLGIVDMAPSPNTTASRIRIDIIDDAGKTIDLFEVQIPAAGGTQLNDLFRARNLGNGPTAAMIRVTPITGVIGAYAASVDNGTNDPTYLAAQLAAH